MTDKKSKEAQNISVDLINDNPEHLRSYFKRKDNQMLLTDFTMPLPPSGFRYGYFR